MLYDFVCLSCGGGKLDFHKWVHCRDPLKIHPGGHMEYGPPQVDHETILGMASCFICRDCKTPPTLYGQYLYSEADLREYLSMTLEERKKMEQDYLDRFSERSEMEDVEDIFDESDISEQKKAQDVGIQK